MKTAFMRQPLHHEEGKEEPAQEKRTLYGVPGPRPKKSIKCAPGVGQGSSVAQDDEPVPRSFACALYQQGQNCQADEALRERRTTEAATLEAVDGGRRRHQQQAAVLMDNNPRLDTRRMQPGPVALLLQSLKNIGGTLTGQRLGFVGERAYDLMDAPINWVRPWLRAKSHAASARAAANRRTTLNGCHDLDVHLNRKLHKGRPDEKQRDLVMIQVGGLWTASSLKHAGFLQDDSCPWCRQKQEDLYHLWWECPEHEHCRARVRMLLGSQEVAMLPRCLTLHGLPPEPAADLQGPLWRRCDCPPGPEREPTSALDLQGDDRIHWAECCEAVKRDMDAEQQSQPLEQWTVRTMTLWLQGDFQALPRWRLPRLDREPMDAPDVYTDGGVDNGQKLWTGQGTWGLFKPRGGQADLGDSLQEVAHSRTMPEGVQAYGQLLGPALSSTRAEAIGLYAGLALPGAHHFGVDNRGAVGRANQILRGHMGGKPWGMQDDGDVWGVFHDEALSRGVGSVRVSKVKGHATEADVQEQRATEDQKTGNHFADDAADRAKSAQRRSHHATIGKLDQRWRHAEEVVKEIQDMMLSILQETRMRREAIINTARIGYTHRKALIVVETPSYAAGQGTRRLRMHAQGWKRTGLAGWQKTLLDWLLKWEWLDDNDHPANPTEHITWLELLIGYELDTNTYLPRGAAFGAQGTNAIAAGEAVGQLTTQFRQHVLQLVERHCTKDALAMFRRPGTNSQKGPARLRCLGISGAWGRTHTCPQWPVALQHQVRCAILKQGGHDGRHDSPLAQGPHFVRPKPIDKQLLPVWREHWEQLLKPCPHPTRSPNGSTAGDGYHIQCQHCQATITLFDKPVKLSNEWPMIKCQSCKKQVRAGAATCLLCTTRVSGCRCGTGQYRQATLGKFSKQPRGSKWAVEERALVTAVLVAVLVLAVMLA